MINEDFCISITGKQKYEDDETEIKVDTLGSYTTKNGCRYIAYKEYDDEENSSGTTAVIKVENDNTLTMTKAGSGTKLVLEKEKRHSCLYDTGYGSMQMGVFTSIFKNNLTDSGGNIRINYTLDINSNFSSYNELYIEIKSTK